MSATTCKHCGMAIAEQGEKAIGETRDKAWQTVWAGVESGEWVCDVTGEEHEPGEPNRPVQVTITYGENETMIRLSLAEYGNFIADPIINALDDGDVAWELSESNPGRLASLMAWARNLYKVTA